MKLDVIKRNNVNVTGKGTQAIVLAAGFGCNQNMWKFLIPAFEQNYKIVLFDYVGAGGSDLSAYDSQKYSNLSGYTQDLVDVLDYLDLKDVIFIGHSVSSIIGLLASIEKPTLFKRLIMIGPSPCYINDLPDYYGGFDKEAIDGLFSIMDRNYIGWVNQLAPIIMKNSDRPELTKELADSFCSTDPIIARNFARVTFYSDNRHDLPKAVVPSLILQCSDDTIAPTSVGEYMLRNMPLSQLYYMNTTGHCPHLSHPKETIELIGKYLYDL
ncbi:sigma-B regulation protein RsbQ [Bacillus mesophilus]|uniref:Alpha/beta hydrolase n=1 Tax=Bacillus mesophilus TaxID=1808955 RepID=A0A6M0Q3D2_9BACI|nr:sigma-B regulation protein RsbQ [Bacillus mesophilus]NEY70887.1 alpha/beta hydrolase [Bacillus mesophilus]